MLFGLGAGAALAASIHHRPWWLAAAALIQLRLLCNMLDGMVALERGTASPVGELYNEIPDRVSDSAVLIGLGYALGGDVLLGYAAAIAAMFTAYVRAMGKCAGAPQEFCGPMAKPQRMFFVTVAALAMGAGLPHPLATWTLLLVTAGSVVTALRRLARISRALKK